MVLEPFSAIGLAGNICQFLDFGGKILSSGREIYQSVDGSAPRNVELVIVYSDLSSLASRLRQPTSQATSLPDNGDDQLRLIAQSCYSLAKELLSALEKLRLDPKQSHRRWKSVRQAIKSVWKEDQIQDMERRLSTFRQQLLLRLLSILR